MATRSSRQSIRRSALSSSTGLATRSGTTAPTPASPGRSGGEPKYRLAGPVAEPASAVAKEFEPDGFESRAQLSRREGRADIEHGDACRLQHPAQFLNQRANRFGIEMMPDDTTGIHHID